MSYALRPVITRPAAVILASCAALSVAAITHHPQVRAKTPQALMNGISNLATMDRAIHTILIVFILLMLYAFCVYANTVRGRLQLGSWGLLLFSLGCGSVIGAALIDGFFTPLYAARYALVPPNLQTMAIPVMTASAIGIQVLTKFGFYAMAGAAAAWALDLLFASESPARIAGAVAACAAIAEFVLIAAAGTLQPHSLAIIALLQAVWCACFAWRLWSTQE